MSIDRLILIVSLCLAVAAAVLVAYALVGRGLPG
jgi:hypothetical protein